MAPKYNNFNSARLIHLMVPTELLSNATNGFILAGGASRRMGRDKALLNWHGRTVLEHMTRLLAQVTATVRTVGRGELPDLQKGLGPLGGVLTALASTESGRNLIVAVDLPLLTVKFLNYFKERSVLTTHALTVCRIESKIPLCIAANPVVRSSLEAYLDSGQRSVHGFIEQVPAEVITADALTSAGISTMIFRNLNSQEDYRAALDCAEATDT